MIGNWARQRSKSNPALPLARWGFLYQSDGDCWNSLKNGHTSAWKHNYFTNWWYRMNSYNLIQSEIPTSLWIGIIKWICMTCFKKKKKSNFFMNCWYRFGTIRFCNHKLAILNEFAWFDLKWKTTSLWIGVIKRICMIWFKKKT